MSKRSIKPFVCPDEEFTKIHNSIFDIVMPALPPNALKVLLCVIRQTFGWNRTKTRDLGYRKILKLTGISSPSTLSSALGLLVLSGCVLEEKGDGFHSSTYQVNPNLELTTVEKFQELINTAISKQSATEIVTPPKKRSATETVTLPATEIVAPPATETVAFARARPDPDPEKEKEKEKEKDIKLHSTANRGSKFDKPKISKKDPRTDHIAIQAFRETTGHYPKMVLYDEVIETIGEHPDKPKMLTCYKQWMKNGSNPVGTAWLFDWYVNGIQERGNGNGSNRQRLDSVEEQKKCLQIRKERREREERERAERESH